MSGNCRLDFRLQFPSIKTQIGQIIFFFFFFVATEKKAVLRRAAIWRLRKTPLNLDGYEKHDSQLVG